MTPKSQQAEGDVAVVISATNEADRMGAGLSDPVYQRRVRPERMLRRDVHWLGRLAGGCLALSIALIVIVGLLGPSAVQSPMPRERWHPPYWFTADPSRWLVTVLLLTALLTGAAGLLLGLRALRVGWSPNPRRLVAASVLSVIALLMVPAMGSSDHLMYAAYGRIAATGGDPYIYTVRQLAERGDPVGQAAQTIWKDTPSIYGPLGTAQQWLAAKIAGPSTHSIVFVLALISAAAFVITGLLLQRLAAGDQTTKARAALLWSLNPLLLYEIVNSAHIDGFAIVWAVAALIALRRSAVLAGVFIGLACAVKISFGLYVLALLWALRHDLRRAGMMLAGGVATLGVMYLPVGLHSLNQLGTASQFVSFTSPWQLAVKPLAALLGNGLARSVIGVLAVILMVILVWLLAQTRLTRPGSSGRPDSRAISVQAAAIHAAAVLTFAWLLTAPYSLPWYDVAAWAPFALLAATGFDGLLTARTTAMACVCFPGPEFTFPAADVIAPMLAVLLLGIVLYRCGIPRRWQPPPTMRPG